MAYNMNAYIGYHEVLIVANACLAGQLGQVFAYFHVQGSKQPWSGQKWICGYLFG